MSISAGGDVESVESFRHGARAWIAGNLTRLPEVTEAGAEDGPGRRDEAGWLHARRLQARLHAGGFAGICYPGEYGGLGLTLAHQRAFNQEVAGYETPALLNTPTFTICAPTILDMGSEEQKRGHLPAAIRGEEVFVQFLSEPAGGSDLAGVTTPGPPDGEACTPSGSTLHRPSASTPPPTLPPTPAASTH